MMTLVEEVCEVFKLTVLAKKMETMSTMPLAISLVATMRVDAAHQCYAQTNHFVYVRGLYPPKLTMFVFYVVTCLFGIAVPPREPNV